LERSHTLLENSRSRPDSRVSFPSYDRGALSPGFLHIGVGGFHRAHQGAFLDELAERRISNEWGVRGLSLRNGTGRERLLRQDCVYSILQRGAAGDEVRVVGALLEYLLAPENPDGALAALASPRTKVLSITVTGNGYGLNSAGELDAHDPLVAQDLATPARPCSLPGYLVEGLRLRRDAGLPPFTVLSCDNIPANGRAVRRAVVSFARLRDERLADWIEQNVAFPATVVDRITPEAGAEDRLLVERSFGIRDLCPVVCEDFTQWIVEDDFRNGRPPLDEVGARFVADVTPYELHKKRLLNGSHCALGYLGYLSGHRRTDEVLADPALRDYVESLIDQEVGPLLPAIFGFDSAEYKRTLLTRLANPRIGDRLQRLCRRGSTKMPAYLIPSLTEAIERGRPHGGLTLAVAAWFRYLSGVDLQGDRIEVEDELAPTLQPLARRAADDPRALLEQRSIFGDLADDERFVERLAHALGILDTEGPAAAIGACRRDDLALVA
jgi:fructuronate reductase/mannitol 2-dehydrogenase